MQRPERQSTKDKKKAFLSVYKKKSINIGDSCIAAGISRMAFENWRARDASFAAALKEIEEQLIDYTENKLLTKIKSGNLTAMIFFLKCKGKHRGWIERQEVTGRDGKGLMDGVVDSRKIADGVVVALQSREVRIKISEAQMEIDARTIALLSLAPQMPPEEDAVVTIQ